MALDRRQNLGQVERLICDHCKKPMISFQEDEAMDPVRGYGKGYVGVPALQDMMGTFCSCPETL